MGNRIILIQGVLHLIVLVMQWIFLFNNASVEYGLIIPILLHIIIMFGSLNSINKNYAKALSKLIAELDENEK